MAVGTPVGLTVNADGVDRNSYPSDSYTPTANRIVIAATVSSKGTSPPNTPTISGNGLTWSSPIITVQFGTIASALSIITAWWGVGASPSTGVTTFDFGGVTQNGIAWSIFEVPGCDLVTPIVAGSELSNRGHAGPIASL